MLPDEKPRIFYGYWIIVFAFLSLFFMSGCSFYSFGLFVAPLNSEFGWNRAAIMTANTIFTLVQGLSTLLVGRIIDRSGPRRIIVMGTLIITLSLGLAGITRNLWQFYLFYGTAGLGFAGIGFIPATTLLFRWFQKRRGWALGISGMGIGVGGFAMPVIVSSYFLPLFGWRMTFLILGLLPSIILIPLVLFVVKRRPEDSGLQPDGLELPASARERTASRQTADNGLSLREALKTRAFWLTALPGAAFGFSTMAIIQHQVPHLTDVGFPITLAAGALGAIGLANAVGKFAFGMACDWINPKYARAIGMSLQILAVVILINVGPTSSALLVWLYSILIGLGLGSWLPTMSLLVTTNFGLAAYGTILGMTSVFNMGGGSFGPLFAGYIFDTQHNYHAAFVTFLLLYILSLIATLLIRRPRIS